MFFTRKPTRPSSSSSSFSSSMAPSLSSLLLPNSNPTTSFPLSSHNPNPYLIRRVQSLNFSVKSTSNNNNNKITYPPPQQTPPEENKRSFADATGDLFLGIASRLLKSSSGKKNGSFSFNGVSFFDKYRGKQSGYVEDEEKIGAVMEDEMEPDVLWEQRVKDIEAEKERRVVTSPGFSFSAAGLLFPYHLGVSQFLLEKGYIKETTPLAGSSAGSIICAVIASGASMQEALDATKILAKDCREKGTAFRLGAVLREVLENFLPEDVHNKCNGRVRIAVTQISWRPKGLLVDQFDSREDLINALITSSFIPGYLAPRPATRFRNRLCIDGGLAFFMPPTSASHTVRVCAFSANQFGLRGIEISPHLNPENEISPRVLFNWILEPAEDDILDRLFGLGYLDAAAWAEENPVDKIVRDDSPSEETSS